MCFPSIINHNRANTQHALGSSYLTKSSSWNWPLAGDCHNLGIHLSSEPSVLLVGVFFAIRGFFQFLNSIAIIPLSLKQPWASREMIEHTPVTKCGLSTLC